MFGIEFAYTLIVVLLCFLVYYKTKEFYDLTRYKGIGYFRNAFLFFGLAYASRFLLHILTFTTRFFFDVFAPRSIVFPLSMVLVGYFSTMAIFYLTYSVIWKKIRYKHFIAFSNITAMIISLVAFISRSNVLLSLLQLLLLVFTVTISFVKHEKAKKKTNIRALYLLIAAFWLINLFLIGPRRAPFEFKFVLQAISLIVFLLIYYKVSKWIK